MRSALSVRLSFALVALASVVASTALSGCRTGSALHGRYDNFRAYYNTYYNATQKLEEGEASLERAGSTVDPDRLLPLFPTTATAGGTGGPFQEAIDKSADLLRERPGSKWADDALLVIGKSYFYQRNFVGAEQKFTETMTAADVTEDRRLRDEARFWLGRTYAASDRFDDGVRVLEEGLGADDGDRRWTSRMRLALGELYARAGRWDEAATTLRDGAADEHDADLAARAYVLLAQVEEHAGRHDEAAAAYALALRQKPAYELAFAAEVGRALVLGLDAGVTDDALDIIGRMLRDDKHYERRGELALVQARLLAAAGRTAEADRRFRDVLYEPDMNGQPVRGRAHYYYGQFHEIARGDYVRASAHYDSAATAYRSPAATDRPSRAAILGLSDQVVSYRSLAEAARQIGEADSLLFLGDLSQEAFQERITAIEAERRRIYQEEQRQLNLQRTAQAFSGSGVSTGGVRNEGETTTSVNPQAALTTGGPQSASAQEAGFLSYRNPASIQAGYIAFEQQWGNRPLLPNWRRLAAVQGGTAEGSALGGVGQFGQNNPFAVGEGPPPLDLSVVPRTPAKREELVTQLAGLRYELANAFFLSLGRADTAAALYRTILAETPSLPVATRARYALAEIELAQGKEDIARPLYRAVIEADPASDLARASRLRLQLEEAPAAPAEATAETSAAYDAARRRWQAGSPRSAAADFIALADAAPDAPSAPRAYLAAAVAYIEAVGGDSLATGTRLPPDLVSPVLVESYEPLPETEPQPEPPVEPEPQEMEPTPRPRVRPIEEGELLPVSGLNDSSEVAVDDEEALLERRRGSQEPKPADDGDPVRDEPNDRPLATPPVPASAPEPTADSAAVELEDLVDVVAPDTASVMDSTATDSIAVPSDAAFPLPLPPDSTEALGPPFTLRQHLAAVAARYPGTPYADRAATLAASLPAPAVSAPDSAGIGPVAVDSIGLAPPDLPPDSLAPDSLTTVPDEPVGDEPAGEEGDLSGLRGQDPLDLPLGGFGWRVQTLSIPSEGESTLRILRGAGFRATIARDPDGAYLLVLGQFDTEAEAEATRTALPAWAQIRGQVVALDGLTLAEPGRRGGE